MKLCIQKRVKERKLVILAIILHPTIPLFLISSLIGLSAVYASVPGTVIFSKLFGDPQNDYGRSVKPTTDGGYIISAGTYSYGADLEDLWIIKTDQDGNEQWNRTFGGHGGEVSISLQQTVDLGYIIA